MKTQKHPKSLNFIIEKLETDGKLTLEGSTAILADEEEISVTELWALIAAGWLVLHRNTGIRDNLTCDWYLSLGPAWWNKKQQEHAEKLSQSSDRLNRSIRWLTFWAAIIAALSLSWSIYTYVCAK